MLVTEADVLGALGENSGISLDLAREAALVAESLIAAELYQPIVAKQFTEERVLKFAAYDIALLHEPIRSVVTVAVSYDSGFSWTTMPASEIMITPWRGAIQRRSQVTGLSIPFDPGRYVITYTAGLFADEASVPEALRALALDVALSIVSAAQKRMQDPSVRLVDPDYWARVKGALKQWQVSA
jgi:hypothetical protein